MNTKTLSAARAEAKRFLHALDEMQRAAQIEGNGYVTYGSKLSGAVRRASMDLTRALADLRRPG